MVEKLNHPREVEFIRDVTYAVGKLLGRDGLKELKGDRLLFMYYAGLSAEEAATMFVNFYHNFEEKISSTKVRLDELEKAEKDKAKDKEGKKEDESGDSKENPEA